MTFPDRVGLPGKAAVSEDSATAKTNGNDNAIGQDNGSSDKAFAELPIDRSAHRFECRSCGYVYDPRDGDKKLGIASGTCFDDLDRTSFRCPVCRARIELFRDIGPRDKPSGFEENLNYGFGVNSLTPGQKNVLIFGGLIFMFACLLSVYSLH